LLHRDSFTDSLLPALADERIPANRAFADPLRHPTGNNAPAASEFRFRDDIGIMGRDVLERHGRT
jgi:hypothetical protein